MSEGIYLLVLFFIPINFDQTVGPLGFFFESRSRYEQRNDINFDSALNQSRTRWQNRGRLGFDYDTGDDSRVRVTFQFSNTQTDDGAGYMGAIRQDLAEGFVEKRWRGGALRLGRQPVRIGFGRLVGTNEWGEVGRFWTGARLENGEWDFFAGRLDVDTAGAGTDYLAFAGRDWGTIGDTSFLYKWTHAGDSVSTVYHTYGAREGPLALNLEGAVQWGRKSGSDLKSWAGSAHVTYTVSDCVGAFAEYNVASGGSDGGTSNTFDDLYPLDHRYNGIMDLQGWRNVKSISVGLTYRLGRSALIRATYYDMSLFDKTDAWYNGRNGLQYGFIDPSGASGTDIGNEFDLQLNMRLPNDLSLTVGFAVFDPGTFVETLSGGNSNQTWFYAGLGWRY